MKNITTNINVGNITRMACIEFRKLNDEVAGTPIAAYVVVQARGSNANCGTTEAQQLANGYAPVVLKITNTISDTYLPNAASPKNQYTDALIKGTASIAGLLDTVLAARAAANENQKENAVLTALSTAGALPPLS